MKKSTPYIIAVVAGALIFKSKDNSSTSDSGTSQSSNTTTSNNSTQATDTARSYTLSEVAQHNSRSDCWTVIDGNVYDVSSFVSGHPGGTVIAKACGIDGTELYNTQDGEGSHSRTADRELKSLLIGALKS